MKSSISYKESNVLFITFIIRGHLKFWLLSFVHNVVQYLWIMMPGSEVEELNGKVQFSSKVHFFGELELNLVHFLAKWTWTELSSLFGWTWTKMNWKIWFILTTFKVAIFNNFFYISQFSFDKLNFFIISWLLLSSKQCQMLAYSLYYKESGRI